MKVTDYMSDYANYFHARRFSEIPQEGKALSLRNKLEEQEHTCQGTWVKRWWQCGGKGMLALRCAGLYADMHFVRCREEVGYERRLQSMLDEFVEDMAYLDDFAIRGVSLRKVVQDRLFDSCCFIYKHLFWGKDQNVEVRMRSISQELIFLVWHNFQAHQIQSWRRS